MTSVSKKRKTDDDAGEKEEPTITSAWESMKKDGPTIYKSMTDYLKGLGEDKESVLEIMGAVYYKSADMENKFVVPAEFRIFTTVRDKAGGITQISDSKNNGLTGYNLKKVLVYSALKSKGIKKVIFDKTNDDTIEVLAIPSGMQIEEASNSKGKKDFHDRVITLYTYKTSTTVYAPSDKLYDLVSINYVTLSEVSNLTKALNSLAQREDISELKVDELDDFQHILDGLDAHEAKSSRKHFFQTLLAAKVANVDMSEKIDQFEKNTSYTLANNLALRLPHGGPCYTKLGNKPETTVSLASLKATDSVLLATTILSQKEYKDIGGDVAEWQVYVDSDNLGGRKNGKFANMSVKFRESAENVRRILKAISTVNSSDKGESGDKPSGKQASKVTSIELD
jgi:hypothetical protein